MSDQTKPMYKFYDLRSKSRLSQKHLADLSQISAIVIVQIETFFEKAEEKRTCWRNSTMELLAQHFKLEVEQIIEFVAAIELKDKRRELRAQKRKAKLLEKQLKKETEQTIELPEIVPIETVAFSEN